MRFERDRAPDPVFTVKDSGARQNFESGMVRDVEDDKPDYTYVIKGPMLRRWAVHLQKGAGKYKKNNWMLAEGEAELDRFERSAARHMIQWLNGERDEDHAAAVFFNINGAEYVRDRMAGDVRDSGGQDEDLSLPEDPHGDNPGLDAQQYVDTLRNAYRGGTRFTGQSKGEPC